MSILETVLALSLFAVAIVGISAAAAAGLRLTGASNGRQAATQAAVRVIELYRTYNFDALALPTGQTYDSSPSSPDAGVSGGTYQSPLATASPEELVEASQGQVIHKGTDSLGGRKVTTYRYVTWTSAAKTEKRLTVVATWQGEGAAGPTSTRNRVVLASIFSAGKVDFPTTVLTSAIPAHAVGATVTLNVATPTLFPPPVFTVAVEGESFRVTAVSGSSFTATAKGTSAHPAGAEVKLQPTGFDPSSSTVPPASTTTTVFTSGSCPSDTSPPAVSSFSILKSTATGAADGFTSSATVTVSANATDLCTPLALELSTTDVFTGAFEEFSGSQAWRMCATDPCEGDRTVFGRLRDAQGNVSGTLSATVHVDTIPPAPGPSGLAATRSADGVSATLTWSGGSSDTNLAGYRVLRQAGGSGSFSTVATVACAGSCSYTDSGLGSGTGFTYFVVAADKAGNTSDASNSASV